MSNDYEYYGRCAFEAWRQDLNWIDDDGSHLSDWDSLSEQHKKAWIAAGNASVAAYKGE